MLGAFKFVKSVFHNRFKARVPLGENFNQPVIGDGAESVNEILKEEEVDYEIFKRQYGLAGLRGIFYPVLPKRSGRRKKLAPKLPARFQSLRKPYASKRRNAANKSAKNRGKSRDDGSIHLKSPILKDCVVVIQL